VKSVVVDTNVVLSFVTDRDPRQQRAAARLFERAASRERRVILPQVVLIEIVYVLQNLYRMPAPETAGLLDDLLAMPSVEVDNEVAWHTVLGIWPGRVRDFADAVLVTVARAGDHAVASFDRKLTRALRSLGVASHPLR
jgi:predicted nucleic acid-binding protein